MASKNFFEYEDRTRRHEHPTPEGDILYHRVYNVPLAALSQVPARGAAFPFNPNETLHYHTTVGKPYVRDRKFVGVTKAGDMEVQLEGRKLLARAGDNV